MFTVVPAPAMLTVVALVLNSVAVPVDVVVMSAPFTAKSLVNVNPTNVGESDVCNPKSTAEAATPFVVSLLRLVRLMQ